MAMIMAESIIQNTPVKIDKLGQNQSNMGKKILIANQKNSKMNVYKSFYIHKKNIWKRNHSGMFKNKDMVKMTHY